MPIEPPDSSYSRSNPLNRNNSLTGQLAALSNASKNIHNNTQANNTTNIDKILSQFQTKSLAIVTNASQATEKQLNILLKNFPALLKTTSSPSSTSNASPQPNQPKNNASVKIYLAELSVAGRKNVVITKSPLNIGEQLIVSNSSFKQNTSTNQSQPISRNLFYKEATTQTKPIPPAIYESIRQALPKQTPTANIVQLASLITQDKNSQLILNNFQHNGIQKPLLTPTPISADKVSEENTIKPNVLQLLQSISQTGIDKNSATSEQIKSLLSNSGTLLESLLSTTVKNETLKAPINNDLKAQLLTLKLFFENKNFAQYNSTKTQKKHDLIRQLHQQTISSLAKIQLNQARSIIESHQSQHDNINPSSHLFFELPMKWEQGVLPLSIEIWREYEKNKSEHKTEKEKAKKEQLWNVKLEFDLPNQEKFYAQVKAKESSVNIDLWSSTREYKQMLTEGSNELSKKLKKHGIDIDGIKVSIGEPSTQEKSFNISLIDIKT
ncbi:MAG: flagellar hook-length control protein FliK [Cellvibrionaceae bacterium]